MKESGTMKKTVCRTRIKSVLAELKKIGGALLLSSSPEIQKSADQHHDFFQNSDFYYLTGSLGRDLILVLSGAKGEATLLARPRDPVRELWDGKTDEPRDLAKALGVKLEVSKDIERDSLSRLRGAVRLYYSNQLGSLSQRVANRLLERPLHERRGFPKDFGDAHDFLGELRIIKTKEELGAIYAAAELTADAMGLALELLRPGAREFELAATFEYAVKMEQAELAFNTIVASGPNAATLHHRAGPRVLKRGELVLLDCGARVSGYCADVTRVFPVGADFNPLQAELYDIVHSAQLAAIKKMRPGATIGAAYDAAAKELTIGLVELGVLRGKVSNLISKKAYLPYFPHGIGHGIGVDIHDGGRYARDTVLKTNMVLTVEPGLYFSKKVKKVPACGVRLEDDVVITRTGNQILTQEIPIKRTDVSNFLVPA